MALAAGTRLGPYEIVAAIGVGGMGEVYRAQDTRLDRVVAIKGRHAGSQTVERSQQEARATSALNHPNICTIYDVGTDPPFIATEFLDGGLRGTVLRRHSLLRAEIVAQFGAGGRSTGPNSLLVTGSRVTHDV